MSICASPHVKRRRRGSLGGAWLQLWPLYLFRCGHSTAVRAALLLHCPFSGVLLLPRIVRVGHIEAAFRQFRSMRPSIFQDVKAAVFIDCIDKTVVQDR